MLVLLLCLTVQTASAAGFLNLERSNRKATHDVTGVVVGGEVKGVQLFGFYDSTRYGEVLAGRTFRLGEHAKTTVYAGAEGLPGCGPKLRGMVITSATLGSFSGLSVIDFAGCTGNFNLKQVSYNLSDLTLSLVDHSGAGSGVRIDWRAMPAINIYVRALKLQVDTGFSYSF